MFRNAIILKDISKDQKGIEIAPWFAPIAPKRDGYNCLGLDVFDTETLIGKGRVDPNIVPEQISQIETVDFVGNAIDIAELVSEKQALGSFDYVVSSHNFEHLPDPIRFLQGCHKILKTGGIVTMAIPDHRACFDYFRPHTLVQEWLEAYHDKRRKPTPSQVFACQANTAMLRKDGAEVGAFSMNDNVQNIAVTGDLQSAYAKYVQAMSAPSGEYIDSHCSVMSPASFELLMLECRQLGLLHFNVLEVAGPVGCEFYVRLQAGTPETAGPLPAKDFSELRNTLLHRIVVQRGVAQQRGKALSLLDAAGILFSGNGGGERLRKLAVRSVTNPVGVLQAIRRRVGA